MSYNTYEIRAESEGWAILRKSGGYGGRIIGVWTTKEAARQVLVVLRENLMWESR